MRNPKLSEVVDLDDLATCVRDGLVSATSHPHLPLQVLCYTRRAQYDFTWPPTVRACRGLIVRPDGDPAQVGDGEVVARPWRKFFTDEQLDGLRERYPDDPDFAPLGSPVAVQEKLDGALGIPYPTPDGPRISTKGSFRSDEAAFASELLSSRYADVRFPPGVTPLFEIIGARRIVVDYGDMADLVLIGVVDNETGADLDPQAADFWPGPVVPHHPHLVGQPLKELVADDEDNREGFVVLFDDGRRVKLKYERYKELHRLATGLTDQQVWRMLSSGWTLQELLEDTPDEFDQWVREVADDLRRRYEHAEQTIRSTAHGLLAEQLGDARATEQLARADAHRQSVEECNDRVRAASDRMLALIDGDGLRPFRQRVQELDVLGEGDPRVQVRREQLASLLVSPDRVDEALKLYRDLVELEQQAERVFAAAPPVDDVDRAEIARRLREVPVSDDVDLSAVFTVISAGDYRPSLWKAVKPTQSRAYATPDE